MSKRALRWSRTSQIVGLVALMGGIGLSTGIPVAQAATSVSVTPNTNLHDRQTVAVTASGFAPGANGIPNSVYVYECTPNPQSFSDCSNATQDFVDIGSDGSGTNPAYQVRTLNGTGTDVIVCDDTHPCVVQVSQDATDFIQPRASAPIAFAPGEVATTTTRTTTTTTAGSGTTTTTRASGTTTTAVGSGTTTTTTAGSGTTTTTRASSTTTTTRVIGTSGCSVTLNAPTANPSQALAVDISNCKAATQVGVASTFVLLQSITPDARGNATASVTIPATLEDGTHEIQVRSADGAVLASAPLTVTKAAAAAGSATTTTRAGSVIATPGSGATTTGPRPASSAGSTVDTLARTGPGQRLPLFFGFGLVALIGGTAVRWKAASQP